MDDTHVSSAAIGGAAAFAVLSWLLAARKPVMRSSSEAEFILRYGLAWRAVVWVLLVLPPAGLLALGLFAGVPKDQIHIPFLMAGGFLALSVPLSIEVFGISHRVGPDGIERGSPWRRARASLAWKDLRTVRWNEGAKWFVLEAADGTRMRVSPYLDGLAPFRHFLLTAAPAAAIDEPTRRQIERIA